MATEHEFGVLLGRYETDNRRRRRIAFVAVPVGAVAACIGVLMLLLVVDVSSGGASIFPSLVCGFGLGAFFVGLWQARLSATRSDEAFTLYQGGLVHSYGGRSWAVSWAEMADVKNNSRDTALNRALGTDIQYSVKLHAPVDGRKSLTVTGLTHDAVRLAETVQQAALHGIPPVRRPPNP